MSPDDYNRQKQFTVPGAGTGPQYQFGVDRILTDDPNAPPLWARFYEIETSLPFFANRDGKKVCSLAQVSPERRAKYAWYAPWGQPVLNALSHLAPAHRPIHLQSVGQAFLPVSRRHGHCVVGI